MFSDGANFKLVVWRFTKNNLKTNSSASESSLNSGNTVSLAGNSQGNSLKITSPADGSTSNSGDTVKVEVVGDGWIKNLIVLVSGYQQPFFTEIYKSNSASFSFQIPRDFIGPFKIWAEGMNESYDRTVETNISLNAFPAAKLSFLSVAPESATLDLPVGHFQSISVYGNYDDSVQRNLDQVNGLKFVIADPKIAQITKPGLVTGLAEGETTLRISYQSLTLNIPVTILPANY